VAEKFIWYVGRPESLPYSERRRPILHEGTFYTTSWTSPTTPGLYQVTFEAISLCRRIQDSLTQKQSPRKHSS